MVFDECKWREAIASGRIRWTDHVGRRMLQWQISTGDVLGVLTACDAIEQYPQDEPFASCLFVGTTNRGIIHVVAAFDVEEGMVHVVTAYRPDEEHFTEGFRRRRHEAR